MIPINHKLDNAHTYNHWIMAARFQNQDNPNTEWDFMFADSINSDRTMTRARNIIASKSILYLQPG